MPDHDRSPPDDEELIAKAQAGDRRSTEALLRRHHDRVLIVCRRMCRDRSDAEDAAQEALIALVRGLPGFDGRSAFSTWVYRVTTNCCLDEIRRRRRRPVPIDDALVPEVRSGLPGPDEVVENLATRATLSTAIDRLPDEFRVPLILRDVADLDYASIGEVLDIAPGTVRSRISRARAKLAGMIDVVDPALTGEPIPSERRRTSNAADPTIELPPREPLR